MQKEFGQDVRVLAFQSYGDFSRYNPHFHALILERSFDEDGNFIHTDGFSCIINFR